MFHCYYYLIQIWKLIEKYNLIKQLEQKLIISPSKDLYGSIQQFVYLGLVYSYNLYIQNKKNVKDALTIANFNWGSLNKLHCSNCA
jgi:hypothetical protein